MNPGVKVRTWDGQVGIFDRWYQRNARALPFCIVKLGNNDMVAYDPWNLEVIDETDSAATGNL